jgi:hypothetical protein
MAVQQPPAAVIAAQLSNCCHPERSAGLLRSFDFRKGSQTFPPRTQKEYR